MTVRAVETLQAYPQDSYWEIGKNMRKRALMLLTIGLGCTACCLGAISCNGQVTTAAENQLTSEQLSQAAERELRSIVAGGRLPDLRWPNFSDHGASVKEFYDELGYKLGWIQGGKPTPQALELIGILEEADKMGLDSKDYDGERWPDRLKSLQTGGAGEESTRVKFDVALTVSGTRYISDLHLGKVDPESLHKDFDPERLHHDAGAFLREEVIAAQSVKNALAKVECPYTGYQRDVVALQKYLQMAKEEVLDALPHYSRVPLEHSRVLGPSQCSTRWQTLICLLTPCRLQVLRAGPSTRSARQRRGESSPPMSNTDRSYQPLPSSFSPP